MSSLSDPGLNVGIKLGKRIVDVVNFDPYLEMSNCDCSFSLVRIWEMSPPLVRSKICICCKRPHPLHDINLCWKCLGVHLLPMVTSMLGNTLFGGVPDQCACLPTYRLINTCEYCNYYFPMHWSNRCKHCSLASVPVPPGRGYSKYEFYSNTLFGHWEGHVWQGRITQHPKFAPQIVVMYFHSEIRSNDFVRVIVEFDTSDIEYEIPNVLELVTASYKSVYYDWMCLRAGTLSLFK